MKLIVNSLIKLGILKKDLDYHLIRISLILIFLFFGYQKWFEYEAQALVPYISHGPASGLPASRPCHCASVKPRRWPSGITRGFDQRCAAKFVEPVCNFENNLLMGSIEPDIWHPICVALQEKTDEQTSPEIRILDEPFDDFSLTLEDKVKLCRTLTKSNQHIRTAIAHLISMGATNQPRMQDQIRKVSHQSGQ